MPKIDFHFQTTFPKKSADAIKRLYNLLPEDEIVLAVWASGVAQSVFDRKGFVLTKNGFAWNFPAMTELAENPGEIKERNICNSWYLERKNITFIEASAKNADTAERKDNKGELQIKTSDTLYTFAFDSTIAQKKIDLLGHAVTTTFTSFVDLNDFEKVNESYSFWLSVLAIKDFFTEGWLILKNKLSDCKKNIETRKEDKIKAKEERKAQKKNSSSNDKIINRIGSFFRHIIDFLTDVILMFAIVIFVKPQLLQKDFMYSWFENIRGIKIGLFAVNWWSDIPEEFLLKRNAIFLIVAVVYIIMKIFISLSCRKNRKAVSFILFAIMIADAFLIADKFLFFILLLLLLMLAVQFSMGFSVQVIGSKAVLFFIVCASGYFIIHVILYPDFREMINGISSVLSFPAKWW